MKRIKIPVVPKSAYNPNRKAGNLIRAQIDNLERHLEVRTSRQREFTEGEAAAYIRQLTRKALHQEFLSSMPVVATSVGWAVMGKTKTKPKPKPKAKPKPKPKKLSRKKR
jgi:hypothetical protein